MRYLTKLAIVLACFYAFWKFRNSTFGQSSFIVAVVGVFVDEWFTKQVRGKKQHGQAAKTRRPVNTRPSGYGEASAYGDSDNLVGLTDFVFILVISALLAVMADAFFFTTWLDLPSASNASGAEGVAAAVKIVTSVLALAVAFLSPVALAVFTYLTCAEWLAHRSRDPQRTGGCVAILPAALVALTGYGHFYLAYLIYQHLGVLRPAV